MIYILSFLSFYIYISCSRSKQPSKKTQWETISTIKFLVSLALGWLEFGIHALLKRMEHLEYQRRYFLSKLTYSHETLPHLSRQIFHKDTSNHIKFIQIPGPAMWVLPELPVSQHMEPPFLSHGQGCRNFPGRSLRSSARKSISVKVRGRKIPPPGFEFVGSQPLPVGLESRLTEIHGNYMFKRNWWNYNCNMSFFLKKSGMYA